MSQAYYQKESNGAETTFKVIPASVPIPVGPYILLTLTSLLLCWTTFGLIMVLAMWAFSVYRFHFSKSATFGREYAEFVVSPSAIKHANGSIPVQDIARIVIRNHHTNTEHSSSAQGFAVGGTGMAGAVAATTMAGIAATASVASAVGNSYRRKVASVSWRLEIESGGKATSLAGGLDETTAYGLMADLSKSVA